MARSTHHLLVLAPLTASLLFLSACGGDASENPAAINGSTEVTRLEVIDTAVGTGERANSGDRITVHYEGYLYDVNQPQFRGDKFDGTSGGEPFTFNLNTGQVIRGWDQGLVGMREGGERTLIIPSALAYGTQGRGPIPPNAALIFDVELVDVN